MAKTRAAAPAPKLPAFRNITEIKARPRAPVIPYFTAEQWKRATRGLKVDRRGKVDRKTPAVRYMPAPWGGGDVIAFHDMELVAGIRRGCKPLIDVRPGLSPGQVTIGFGFECIPEPKLPIGSCELIIRAFPGAPPDGISPWDCDKVDCTGRCKLVLVGTPSEGELQCQCKAKPPGGGLTIKAAKGKAAKRKAGKRKKR